MPIPSFIDFGHSVTSGGGSPFISTPPPQWGDGSKKPGPFRVKNVRGVQNFDDEKKGECGS